MLRKFIYIFLIIILGSSFVYSKNKFSKQKIIEAIKGGVITTEKLLKKVPIDYISPEDDTLLHYAVRFRKRKVVEYLVNRKILISRKGGLFYGTALEEAIYYGYLGIASYLIDEGTLLNIQDVDGNTALHIAAKNGYLDIIKQLIENGASKNIVNNEGQTPYDLIPDLSWDSKKKLQEVLKITKHKKNKFSNRIYINIGNNKINKKKNTTLNFVDKKTKIDSNSNIGIDINVKHINKF
jgi:ankyrin repeat protein